MQEKEKGHLMAENVLLFGMRNDKDTGNHFQMLIFFLILKPEEQQLIIQFFLRIIPRFLGQKLTVSFPLTSYYREQKISLNTFGKGKN